MASASSTSGEGRDTAATLGASSRRRRPVVALLLAAAVAVVAAMARDTAPPEESLENATFFAPGKLETAPTTTSTTVAITSPVVETTDPDAWERLVPDTGVLVASSPLTSGLVDVWSEPDDTVAPAWQLGVPTEFGGYRHFQVLAETEDWVQIKVPVRPNGSVGWIPKDDVTFSVSTMRVLVDVSDRRVTVFDGDTVVFETTGAVGRDAYPTPIGEWYLRDVLPWDEQSVYGPYVLALSAFSEQIDEINGGQAVIALHGTSRPDQLGSAVSLGCVRLSNDDITTVATLVPVGSPVSIVA